MGKTEGSYKADVRKSTQKPSNSKGWERVSKPKPQIRQVLELITERPHSRREIIQIINFREKTVDGILSKLVNEGTIKRLRRGIYAYKTYEPEEEKIILAIEKTVEDFLKECEEKKATYIGYDVKSLLADFVQSRKEYGLIEQVAIRTGNDPKNPEFRKRYFKLLSIVLKEFAKKFFK